MNGEVRMMRDVLKWGVLAAPVGVAAGFIARGADGALSVAAGIVLVLANTAVAALILAWAAKRFPAAAPAAALPSYAIRMIALTVAMAALLKAPFIDTATFLATFCVAVVGAIAVEARTLTRTPWVALTLMNDRRS